ncbi:50S ribosomal protein L39e [Candidatus Woesearchaeota archaeon]|nr:MAG: 50S ribosomal protein L39e [Candidatus Woesearchaeota archaeon ex4484_78]RLE45806.1 MAG: 50S ribosomal protein L39e [Candidatus Woesearchaeota archaeon]
MARYKHPARKQRLVKKNRQTRWAPFWLIPKIFGKGRRVHPVRATRIKRNWRRTKLKV